MTGNDIMRALRKNRVDLAADEIRIEFDGDDNTEQELRLVEKRIDPDGVEFFCLVVGNA